MIVVCMAFGYDHGVIPQLINPNVLRIDGSLGISDAIQKGDLLAMTDDE